MRLKLFGRTILTGKDLGHYIGRSDDFFGLSLSKYGTDYKIRNELKAYKNAVYGCVSLIGEACGEYEPLIQRKDGDQWKTIDHDFNRLLRRPTGNEPKAESFSQFNLWEATASYMVLQGDCYWYMARGKTTGRPREIVILRKDKVGIDVDKDTGEINGYFVRQATGTPIPLEVEEILHFPLFDPEDPYGGKSVISAGSDYILTDESTATYTKNFFGNNAGLSGVLNVKGEVTKGAFAKFVRAWRDKYEGVDNAGKVAILRDSDAEFTKVGLGLDELDMKGLREMSLADVFMMFKVPPELLGKITSGSGLGRANIEVLEYIFAKYNIDKKFKRFDSILQFALERYYPKDTNLRVTHANIIPEDKEFALKERVEGVDKWKKRNEIRDEDGLDSVDGGDQLFVPINAVPVNESSLTPPADKEAGLKVKIIRRKIVKAPEALNAEKAERFRVGLMRNQSKYERQYKRVVKPIFVDQRVEALRNLEAHASAITKDAEQKLFDDASYDLLLVNALTPMLTDMTATQGALALIFAGDTESEFMLTAQIEAALQRGTRKMASGFNNETIERLNKTLAEGIREGEGIGELKKRVNGVYDDLERYRIERIARTETLKASNRATMWAYKQTGYVTAKTWVVNPGACPECSEFEGKTVSLDDAFLGLGESYSYTDEKGEEQTSTNDYDVVETPPLHPNCRCTIVPVRDVANELNGGKLISKDKYVELQKYTRDLEKMIGIDEEDEKNE